MASASFLILLFIGIGLLMAGWGAVMLFDRDTAWKLQERNNRIEGVKSERTEEWESSRGLNGVGLIVIGVLMFIFAIYLNGEFAPLGAPEEPSSTQIAATAQSKAARLDELFATSIRDWQADDTEGVKRYSWKGEQHLANVDVVYGRCVSGNFYAYILDVNYFGYGETYGYVPDSSPETCKPAGMQTIAIRGSKFIDLSGGWYQVSTYSQLEDLITPTPLPPTATLNATQQQATLDAAIQQQVATAKANSDFPVTQTIAAAVQSTMQALTNSQPTPTPAS